MKEKAGNDFLFTLCSEDCRDELKEALELEKEIGELIFQPSIFVDIGKNYNLSVHPTVVPLALHTRRCIPGLCELRKTGNEHKELRKIKRIVRPDG